LPAPEARRCILCNNAGAGYCYVKLDGKMPPMVPFEEMVGALPDAFFDRAVCVRPMTDGSLGGPLLRTRIMDFDDGQLVTFSFTRGLADIGGMGLFLQVWSRLCRGEDPGPAPTHRRTILEAALRGEPGYRVETGYALLHRRGEPPEEPRAPARPGPPTMTLACFVLSAEELRVTGEELSQSCRKKRLIYDSESLTDAELAFSLVSSSIFGSDQVPASLSLDLRSTFMVDRHFGSVRGVVDIDLPQDRVQAAGVLHRHPTPALQRDFWNWKRIQPVEGPSARLELSSWLEALGTLDELSFGGGLVTGVTTGGAYWQQYLDGRGADCPAYTVLLPHPSGALQVQALLPRAVADRIGNERPCQVWHPA